MGKQEGTIVSCPETGAVYKRYIQKMLQQNAPAFCPFRKERQMDYLFDLLRGPFQEKGQSILEAGCGYGRLIYFLNNFDAEQYYHGIDYVEELIGQAKKEFAHEKNIFFESADILKVSKKYLKKFDISISYKTLSWLPYYEKMMSKLFMMTKKRIYITSLFYDGDIDFITKIYQAARENSISYAHLNTYSYLKFEKFCKDMGARAIKSFDMKLDIELPRAEDLNRLQLLPRS